MEATKELLEKQIKLLSEARDGVGKAFNLLKIHEGIEDEHLRKLYLEWDSKIKSYSRSIGILLEEDERCCVAN